MKLPNFFSASFLLKSGAELYNREQPQPKMWLARGACYELFQCVDLNRVSPTRALKMDHQLDIKVLSNLHLFKMAQRFWFSPRTSSQILSVEAENLVSADVLVEPMESGNVEVEYIEDDYDDSSSRKRSKKRKIYCFNCNRQEFHIMAYKGTSLHSLLVGMTFGLARIFGPYRCTCCGKKRAMFADFCSLSYHWRMFSERRLSKTGRRRSSRSSSRRRR